MLCAAGLLLWAGFAWGLRSGYARGAQASEIDPPVRSNMAQTVVLGVLGVGALGAALALQGPGVRIPVPARLDDLTARAEKAAVERAERAATDRD